MKTRNKLNLVAGGFFLCFLMHSAINNYPIGIFFSLACAIPNLLEGWKDE